MINEKHYEWIDFAKSIAIIAVILDHTFGITYKNDVLHYHTAFSVTLFIFLAGITASISIGKHDKNDKNYLFRRIKVIFIPYFFATLVYSIYNNNFMFDLYLFIKQLITFSASGPFYFVFFFMQLVLCSVVIYKIFQKCNGNILKGIGTLLFIYLLCVYFNRYTSMGPIYGGGNKLLGGSYLFVFSLGIIFYQYIDKLSNKKTNIEWLIMVIVAFTVFEKYKIYYKTWSNPPNKYTIFYTLLIFSIIFIVNNIFTLKSKLAVNILNYVNMVGKNSLYVFLYHSLIIEIFLKYNFGMQNTILYKILIVLCSLIVPVFVIEINRKIIKLYKSDSIKKQISIDETIV